MILACWANGRLAELIIYNPIDICTNYFRRPPTANFVDQIQTSLNIKLHGWCSKKLKKTLKRVQGVEEVGANRYDQRGLANN